MAGQVHFTSIPTRSAQLGVRLKLGCGESHQNVVLSPEPSICIREESGQNIDIMRGSPRLTTKIPHDVNQRDDGDDATASR